MHYEEDHDGQCECEFVNANPTILKKHKKTHGLLYTCDLCAYSTKVLENLNDHNKRLWCLITSLRVVLKVSLTFFSNLKWLIYLWILFSK